MALPQPGLGPPPRSHTTAGWTVLLSALLIGSGLVADAAPLRAQEPAPTPGRLTVRPKTMATGTRTAQAGEQMVEALSGYLVYTPPSCVGTTPCPLVVVLHGGGGSAKEQLGRHRELADQYGMIMLLGTSVEPGRWDVIDYFSSDQLKMGPDPRFLVHEMPDARDVKNIDAAMKYTLEHYAVDPAKIALLGMSDGAAYTLFLGRNNLDVFSRLAAMSPGIPFNGAGPANPATQVFMLGGIAEGGFFQSSLLAAKELKASGHQVKQAVLLRPHQQRRQDYDVMFRWLKESWATAGTPPPPTPRAVTAANITALTGEALVQMNAFWSTLMRGPDSVLKAGRRNLRTEISIPVGELQLLLPMFDIPAMAAQFPSVAEDLKAAGLTARQEEDYAVAIISALATKRAGNQAGAVPAGSTLAKNIEFLDAHQSDVDALGKTNMWTAQ